MKLNPLSFLKVFFVTIAIMAGSVTLGHSANVALSWDANVPAPEGYRVFVREGSQGYNYDQPIWEGGQTTCTLVSLVEGVTYHFVVRAFEADLESADSEEVSYTPAAVVSNQAPTASAGANQSVYEGTTVTLDGSGSSDADGSIAGYQWVQTGGTTITLMNPTQSQASFTAPVVDSDGETFSFRLTVTDNDGSSAAAMVSVTVLKSSGTDSDGDNVADIVDRFPNDPSEWADNDGDGLGDNQDPDDDNDGMTDVWESAHGLNPLSDDAALDADGDGISNLDEFQAGTDPVTAADNTPPNAPSIDAVTQTERVPLTPVLVAGDYFDTDNDAHYQSQWQIGTESDFSALVLDETSQSQLSAYTVGAMVLDVDTVYYWRVRYIDARSGVSDWSPTGTFTTLAADLSDDANVDGIPDAQAVDESVDVNENGIPDALEDTIMSVNTVEGQTIVGVETVSDKVSLVAIKSLPTTTIADTSVKLGFGLVGFKLYLQDGVSTATVTIHFSRRVPKDAQLYKYATDSGWQVYENAVFAPNRKSVTLVLEDGGMGDEDGIENGVIVDPSGVAYTDSAAADSASLSTGTTSAGSSGGGCFITTGVGGLGRLGTISSHAAAWMSMMLLAAGLLFAVILLKIDKDR